jgi:hypothetical protein
VPLILISFSINVWQVHNDPISSFFLPQTRFWELWMGGTLAYLDIFGRDGHRRFTGNSASIASAFSAPQLTSPPSPFLHNISSVFGVLLIGLALLLVHEHTFPGWWALLPVCGASLLIWAGPAALINRAVLSNGIAVFLGLISYPLYLWHWPILSFARILRGNEISSSARIIAVAVGLVLAWATWRFVESPIRFGRKLWTKTAALALISVIVCLIGYSIQRHSGFPRRLKNLSADLDWAHPETETTPDCAKTVGSDELIYCRSLGTGPPDVLLIGDSHAGYLYRGLAPAYVRRSHTLMNLGEPGCVPFYDTESYALGMRHLRDCQPFVNQMLEFAASAPSVRTVILSARGPFYMRGDDFGQDSRAAPERLSWNGAPKNSSQSDIFAASFRNTVVRLSAAGRHVIIFMDWPELGFDPKSCLPRPVPLFSPLPRPLCGVPRSQVDTRNRAYREVIFQMKKEFSGLAVFDPFPYLCDSSACYAMKAGHLLYEDNNHLSAAGAIYLSGKLLAEEDSLGP